MPDPFTSYQVGDRLVGRDFNSRNQHPVRRITFVEPYEVYFVDELTGKAGKCRINSLAAWASRWRAVRIPEGGIPYQAGEVWRSPNQAFVRDGAPVHPQRAIVNVNQAEGTITYTHWTGEPVTTAWVYFHDWAKRHKAERVQAPA